MNIISDCFTPVAADASLPFVSVELPRPVAVALAGARAIRHTLLNELVSACRDMQAQTVVACPLFWGESDALCVISALQEAEFRGTLVVASPPLPDPTMVEREVRAAARGLTLRFVTV